MAFNLQEVVDVCEQRFGTRTALGSGVRPAHTKPCQQVTGDVGDKQRSAAVAEGDSGERGRELGLRYDVSDRPASRKRHGSPYPDLDTRAGDVVPASRCGPPRSTHALASDLPFRMRDDQSDANAQRQAVGGANKRAREKVVAVRYLEVLDGRCGIVDAELVVEHFELPSHGCAPRRDRTATSTHRVIQGLLERMRAIAHLLPDLRYAREADDQWGREVPRRAEKELDVHFPVLPLSADLAAHHEDQDREVSNQARVSSSRHDWIDGRVLAYSSRSATVGFTRAAP